MLKYSEITKRQDELTGLLQQLESGAIECIEYGNPVARHMSYLRIRFMETAGGKQFGIRCLSYGIEGSGDYAPDAETAIQKAMDAMLHYNRPMGGKMASVLKALREKATAEQDRMGELCFFAVTEASCENRGQRRLLGDDPLETADAVVIELKL